MKDKIKNDLSVEIGTSGGKRPHIIVVDDEPSNLQVLRNILEDEYDLSFATSGQKAMELVTSQAPDMVLLDVEMPGMGGYEVCQALKADPETGAIPVIFVTGKAEEKDEEKGLDLGAVDYITKPVVSKIVKARVRGHLAQAQALAYQSSLKAEEIAGRLKSEFLASMSHELRTPLNAVIGFSDLLIMLSGKDLSADQMSYVDAINKAGKNMLTMIEKILMLNDIISRSAHLSTEYYDPFEVICDSAHKHAALAETFQVHVSLEDEHNGSFTVNLDQSYLSVAIDNLISNAIKFNKPGGSVKISCQEHDEETLRFIVEDTGFGIPHEQINNLYKPFERLGREALEIDGAGVGLTLVQKIMSAFGGDVGFVSEEGVGSTFWIDMPKNANSIENKNIGLRGFS